MQHSVKPIGGYFSLELPTTTEYHRNAIKLNSGKNCIEYILLSRHYKKVYIPYYTCSIVLKPFQKLGISYEFYHIDFQLEIAKEIKLCEDEALLYTNYYGLKHSYVKTLASKYGNQLIVDNTQAFYAKPISGIDTFYTCRKFFGVADGAYLYTDTEIDIELTQDVSYERMSHLLKRIDLSAEEGYEDFHKNDEELGKQPIMRMSKLTEAMMKGIDYSTKANKRIHNFHLLDKELRETNRFKWDMDYGTIPLVYPYYVENGTKLRQKLIESQVFCARYWPNVMEWCDSDDLEYQLAENVVCLPVDQRYGEEEMNRIIEIIKK